MTSEKSGVSAEIIDVITIFQSNMTMFLDID